MPPTTHLLTFAITAFALIAVPGPSVLFVVSRAIALGRVVGVATVTGNMLGAFVQVVAVAFGIGPLVERSVALFTVMKLAGAGYLMFLGVQAIRHRRSLATALATQVERKAVVRIVLDGFTVGATNPKVIVFFAAMLPQFVDRQADDVPAQIIVLGAIFAAIALLSDSIWALIAGTARAWLTRSPRRLELIGGTGGLVMIGIGARLALTGRNDLYAPHGRFPPYTRSQPSGIPGRQCPQGREWRTTNPALWRCSRRITYAPWHPYGIKLGKDLVTQQVLVCVRIVGGCPARDRQVCVLGLFSAYSPRGLFSSPTAPLAI